MDANVPQPFDPPSTSNGVVARPFYHSVRFWIPAIVCVFALVAVPVAFTIGAVIGNTQIYHKFSEHQSTRIEAFLEQHPGSFGSLTVVHASNGWAFLTGSVPTQSDYDLLADGLREMFGDDLGNRMIRSVVVEAGS